MQTESIERVGMLGDTEDTIHSISSMQTLGVPVETSIHVHP